MKQLFYCTLLLCGIVGSVHAGLELSNVFTRNMVLQRDAKNPVFGSADPGATVQIDFKGQKLEATANQYGNWLTWLAPMPANKEGTVLTVESGGERETVPGIVVGDVWYAAGDYGLVKQMNPQEAEMAATGEVPPLRQYLSRMGTSPYPLMQHPASSMYKLPDEKSYKSLSPVLYAFAQTGNRVDDVPVGFFSASGRFGILDALPADAAAYLKHPANQELAAKMRAASLKDPEGKAAYAAYVQAMRQWIAETRERVRDGLQPYAMPEPPNADLAFGGAFNARVHPVHLFPIRGVIWYVFDRENYKDRDQAVELYEAMVKGWRDAFDNPELPFYFVQHHYPSGVVNTPKSQAALTLMQQELLQLPHTGLAATYDLHDRKGWDLANRFEVGQRLALWSLGDTYGQSVEPLGPSFKSLTVENGRALVEFDHVGGGLMAADKEVFGNPVPQTGDSLNGFMLAGADGKWQWAEAKLVGDHQVLLWSDKVPDPVRAAYAVNNSPEKPNLYSGKGLPALPFSQERTEP